MVHVYFLIDPPTSVEWLPSRWIVVFGLTDAGTVSTAVGANVSAARAGTAAARNASPAMIARIHARISPMTHPTPVRFPKFREVARLSGRGARPTVEFPSPKTRGTDGFSCSAERKESARSDRAHRRLASWRLDRLRARVVHGQGHERNASDHREQRERHARNQRVGHPARRRRWR